jgi:hypothetical protein
MVHLLPVALAGLPGTPALVDAPMRFWAEPRQGTNLFNLSESSERFEAARALGVDFVRLSFTQWTSSSSVAERGGFLAGSFDRYEGLVEADLRRLKAVLDLAHRHELRVVLTTMSLPGRRWHALHGAKFDTRLWQDLAYHEQAARFWRDLARALHGHPALVGYNPVNEPDPERGPGGVVDWRTDDHRQWCERVEGTAADLDRLYATVVGAIREVDATTPIVLDASFYAHPWALACLQPLRDPQVLYAVHMYEPWAYTRHTNRGTYGYPGDAPVGEVEPTAQSWDLAALKAFLAPVAAWQRRHGVPARRILVEEFGVFRWAAGGGRYLADLIAIFEAHGWHWAWWSFREDRWAHMDVELGPRELPASYWKRVEAGEAPSRVQWYGPNPLLDAIRDGLRK